MREALLEVRGLTRSFYGVRALAAHPLVRSVDVAEELYAELAAAHRAHLPERLIPA